MTAIAVSIAGSDSGGGAGIQADLKTFSALGVYGATVVTALTAQNTLGVHGVELVTPAFVSAQIDAVYGDLTVKATKIGMLANSETIDAVAAGLIAHDVRHIVLDPVMVATSGDVLLDPAAEQRIVTQLFPIAALVTPNLHEAARLLAGDVAASAAEMQGQAQSLLAMGAAAVYLKGGHSAGEQASDILVTADDQVWFHQPRIDTVNTHGTGCTLSSAVCAGLAQGLPMIEAVGAAKDYISRAIASGDQLKIGSGHGPVNHFHRFW
jgi:hydroxymethylpyrimidine/phosphomethylpyrimidine kinase